LRLLRATEFRQRISDTKSRFLSDRQRHSFGIMASRIPIYHVITSFKTEATEDIFNGVASKKALKACPQDRWDVARRKLDQLNFAVSLDDLRIPPGNQLEALQGDRDGQHSIRINQQYRICFTWTQEGAENVEIVDYH